MRWCMTRRPAPILPRACLVLARSSRERRARPVQFRSLAPATDPPS